jgi:hypothetical protein
MTQPPRTFTLKDQAPAAIAYGSACRQGARKERPATSTPGRGGETEARSYAGGMASTGGDEVRPEGGFEAQDAAREWLQHLEAGHFD